MGFLSKRRYDPNDPEYYEEWHPAPPPHRPNCQCEPCRGDRRVAEEQQKQQAEERAEIETMEAIMRGRPLPPPEPEEVYAEPTLGDMEAMITEGRFVHRDEDGAHVVRCPHCGRDVRLTSGQALVPEDLQLRRMLVEDERRQAAMAAVMARPLVAREGNRFTDYGESATLEADKLAREREAAEAADRAMPDWSTAPDPRPLTEHEAEVLARCQAKVAQTHDPRGGIAAYYAARELRAEKNR